MERFSVGEKCAMIALAAVGPAAVADYIGLPAWMAVGAGVAAVTLVLIAVLPLRK